MRPTQAGLKPVSSEFSLTNRELWPQRMVYCYIWPQAKGTLIDRSLTCTRLPTANVYIVTIDTVQSW